METLVKPFLHELISGLDNPAGIKKSKNYAYLIRVSVFIIAYLESYPFREDLDIFAVLGVEETPEFVGVALAAIIITFGSKQVHDLAQFVRLAIANRGKPSTEVIEEF